MELCDALIVPRPQPRGSGYEFEFQIDAITVDGRESANFIDCWKAGFFALEGKDDEEINKGKAANESLLRRAFGQVRNYVHHVPGAFPPPYLMVLDVGATLIVWDRWAGTYGGFEAGRRIDLGALHERPDDIALLRDVWENPSARDRRGVAQAVTTEIATTLAELAAALEARGNDQEVVARFLMRVVFSCFAEDVGLLPAESFRRTITETGINGSPGEFAEAVEQLWRQMDTGGRFGLMKVRRFNGHFFRDASALHLTRAEINLLENAARADWAEVEPSIFGTLLTRALDPEERHRLGAEYTPRAFIERLIRPTIEEPVLEKWTAVQAEVVQLLATEKAKDRVIADARLVAFHEWLCGLRILDPACGSGNFLYVAMHALKRIEHEVLQSIQRLRGPQTEVRMEEIGPWQFFGIEIKPWAREIAELTLWIGFHQFWKAHHDVQAPEPILRDTGTLELRDAVLAWDSTRPDPSRDRPDPTPRVRHPVTGDLVPDPTARLEYVEYLGARPAPWPEADFIVGNPPYLGQARQRDAFGDGYVDALRATYTDVPDAADFVMYWWHCAAEAVAQGRTLRAGLITTNSIVQPQNRAVVAAAASHGAHVVWAVADHPWIDAADGAAVRVAMTVIATSGVGATKVLVDDDATVLSTIRTGRLNADLTAHADVPTAARVPLRSNAGLSSRGVQLIGAGFIVSETEAATLISTSPPNAEIVRPYRNGRDLTSRPRGVWVIDFGLRDENEARQFPVLFDLLRYRVKPERDANNDKGTRQRWWQFGRNREDLRSALFGLTRYIATVETSKHRFFTFLDEEVAPDNKLLCIASDDPFVLGVLSSQIHRTWALAAGGRLGVGNDPVYIKTLCFDPFPFPDAIGELRTAIGDVAVRLDNHRIVALSRDPLVTMTGMYNVIEKLKTGDALTAKELATYESAACGVLRDLHEELDALVAKAYGWTWPASPEFILERLVAVHDQRFEEERAGQVRWLRPEYQRPRFSVPSDKEATLYLENETTMPAMPNAIVSQKDWPADAIGQITALRALAAASPCTVDEAIGRFVGARRNIVARHLDTLAMLGEVEHDSQGRYRLAAGALTAG